MFQATNIGEGWLDFQSCCNHFASIKYHSMDCIKCEMCQMRTNCTEECGEVETKIIWLIELWRRGVGLRASDCHKGHGGGVTNVHTCEGHEAVSFLIPSHPAKCFHSTGAPLQTALAHKSQYFLSSLCLLNWARLLYSSIVYHLWFNY